MEKTVFSSKFHWGYKLLLRASLSGSRWPTQKELDALFGDYLSHNVWSGHLFFSVLQVLCICIMASGLCPYGILVSLSICVSAFTCVSCIFSGSFLCLFIWSDSSLLVFVLLYYYPLDACFLFFYYSMFRCLGILFVFTTIMGQCIVR